MAGKGGFVEVVQLLLENRANVNLIDQVFPIDSSHCTNLVIIPTVLMFKFTFITGFGLTDLSS